jgi:predicted MFS family arabinose efflux permease
MPVFIKDIFKLNASGLGMFMSAMGLGALFGTIRIATTKTVTGIRRTVFISALMIGILVVLFAFIRNIYLSLAVIAVLGFFVVLQMGLTNTLVQVTTTDEMRGRVMGFFVMAFMGFAPIGSIIAGFLAHQLSTPVTVALGGLVSVLFAIILRGKILPASS